jgi:hypothetical protein
MSGDRRQKILRRFAPEVYVSGFRVKPGMTRVFGVSPGVGFGIAWRSFWIPGQAWNDEGFGVSPGVGFGIGRRGL